MTYEDKVQLFKETAAIDTPDGRSKFQAFAASLTGPILKKVEEVSVMRQLFTVERLAPGAQASYPIAEDFDSPVWILPGLAYVAQDYIEAVGEEVFVPTFSVAAAKDWKVSYARDGRIDIVVRAQQAVAKALAAYEEEAGWRVVVPATTKNFVGAGILPPRPAPIYEMPSGDPAAGYLSKELINRMSVGMLRLGRKLQELWVSPEDIADIREWTETDVDPVTRREIFQMGGMGSIWGVRLRVVDALGVRGKYNIHGYTSAYGPFRGDNSGGAGDFNDYSITHGNILDADGNLTTAGETQVYGFDLSDISLVMPIRKDYEAHDDPTLLRKQKQGFFGWEEFGMACLDSRFISMGVIDRYTA